MNLESVCKNHNNNLYSVNFDITRRHSAVRDITRPNFMFIFASQVTGCQVYAIETAITLLFTD